MKNSIDEQYRTAKVMSASPLELILIMYEKFFELIPTIKSNMEKHLIKEIEQDTELALEIIDELINCLDFSVEISKDLGAIYYYARNLIMDGHIKLDPVIWDEVESTMRPLYEGFTEASKQYAAPGIDPLKAKSTQIVAGMTYGHGNLHEVVVNTRNGLRA